MGDHTDKRILDGLGNLIAKGHPVVWWADPEAEFSELVPTLSLGQAELIDVGKSPATSVEPRIPFSDARPVEERSCRLQRRSRSA